MHTTGSVGQPRGCGAPPGPGRDRQGPLIDPFDLDRPPRRSDDGASHPRPPTPPTPARTGPTGVLPRAGGPGGRAGGPDGDEIDRPQRAHAAVLARCPQHPVALRHRLGLPAPPGPGRTPPDPQPAPVRAVERPPGPRRRHRPVVPVDLRGPGRRGRRHGWEAEPEPGRVVDMTNADSDRYVVARVRERLTHDPRVNEP